MINRLQAGDEVEVFQIDIRTTVRQISKSSNIESACLIAEKYFLLSDHQLLSVVFCDTQNEKPTIRPFRKVSEPLANLNLKLRDKGGCPITKEALRVLHPFDSLKIDRSQYKDFLSIRFLDELAKLGYGSILAVPVLLGRGLALFTVGIEENSLSADEKMSIVDAVCHILAAIISRFPEVTTLFESKRLSTLEAEALLFASNGYTDQEIGIFLKLNEITIGLLLRSAMSKLNARNRSQMVANALAFGEISNMQFFD